MWKKWYLNKCKTIDEIVLKEDAMSVIASSTVAMESISNYKTFINKISLSKVYILIISNYSVASTRYVEKK